MSQDDPNLLEALKYFGCKYIRLEYSDGVYEEGNNRIRMNWDGKLRLVK